MENNNVFLSYSRHDLPFVEQLSDDLRQQGINVWIDTENIDPGQSWQQEIERGLQASTSLVFVISKNSIKSQWMLTELGTFGGLKKKIFPVIIEDVDVTALPHSISSIQWADFRQSYQSGFQKLISGLDIDISNAKPVASKSKKIKGYTFISYAEEDSDFASLLKKFLKENGYAYWDYEESDRDYHSQLFLELEGVIIEASATTSILSEAWKRSEWAIKEFFFSQEVKTPVFLLKARKLGPTLAIAGMTYIDFVEDLSSGFSKLDKELRRKNL